MFGLELLDWGINFMHGKINDGMKKPSFREALAFWLKLGFISFGGPAGQVAIMHEFLVEK